ncbi:cation:proton antiporter, partial [uncultured Salegentibacter sp.]|uniref:cation:proton antiporter domain-containing protein n=1 Tax=uncultured Salegentibacter sp. TaxID=259320 RepID=UPI0030D8FFAC
FTIPVFFIFGLLLPWKDWIDLGIWTSVSIIFVIILFRRIPSFLLFLRLTPQFKSKFKDQLLVGWFGPIGVAALYYAILTLEKTKDDTSWIITSLVVMASTLIHGLSSLAFSKWYAKLVNKSNKE